MIMSHGELMAIKKGYAKIVLSWNYACASIPYPAVSEKMGRLKSFKFFDPPRQLCRLHFGPFVKLNQHFWACINLTCISPGVQVLLLSRSKDKNITL